MPARTLLWSVLSLALVCCGPNDEAATAAADAAIGKPGQRVDLAPPEHGVQVATLGRDIAAGADEEWCEVLELPGDPADTVYVGRIELAMTPFSHHLIVSMAPDGSTSLDDAEVGKPTRCEGAHLFGTDLLTLAASAKPYSSREPPTGIGRVLHGGQRLVFDYHSLNTGSQALHVEHRLNLHYLERITKPARTFGFYNQYIQIPAHTTRAFADSCQLKDDLLVWSIARHTHQRGTDFRVWWSGGEHDGELIWTSHDWEQDIDYDFDEPVQVPAGTGFRWECAFDNPTDETLVFGPQATDEMCILFGAFAAVGDDDAVPAQSCYRFTPPAQ